MHLNTDSPITKEDLQIAKYWIKGFYNGGVKQFAKDNKWAMSSVSAVLNNRRHNPEIIAKAAKVAVEIAGPIANNFRFLKNLPKLYNNEDTDGRSPIQP